MQSILSIDNEIEILKLLHVIFKRAGYQHQYTTDNQEALQLLQQQPLDLFTQNIMRPNTNGCEFYQLMRKNEKLSRIPILIITSLNPFTLPPPSEDLITNLYPQQYLTTPFLPQQLIDKVKAILTPSQSFQCQMPENTRKLPQYC